MPSITIRELPVETKERLRVQAAQAGLSLEAHTRRVLQDAAMSEDNRQVDLLQLASQCFGRQDGVNLKLASRATARPPVTFD